MRIAVAVAVAVAVAATIVAGCRFDLPDTASDGPRSCTASDSSCVCLNPPGVCVECTATDVRNCSGTKPACGGDNRCRACRANDECDSGACLETGACAMASQVIYAAPTGSSTPGCGMAPGAGECSLTQAIMELGTRTIIRLARGNYSVSGTDGADFAATSGTLIARDAVLTRSTTGPLVSVRNGQSLKLIGGILRGPNGSDGVRCNTGSKLQIQETIIEKMDLSGVRLEDCELTVSRAILRLNLRGGINMIYPKVATITNNYIYRNGQGTLSAVGGMSLKLSPGSKVELNTVVDNYADFGSSTAGGIICDGNGYDAPYNLIYRNQGGTSTVDQVIGTCTFQGSYQQAAQSPSANAVMFENPNDSQNPSYRLTAASPAEVRDRVVAGYNCQNLTDFEGDTRPQGSACDCGADEFRVGQ